MMITKTYITSILIAASMTPLAQSEEAENAKPLPTPQSEFKRLDKNSDWKLSLEELAADRGSEKARNLIAKKDINKDGFLQLKECRIALVWKYPKAVFAVYDSNKDGKIDLKEFTDQVKKKDQATSWFNSLDWDNNSKLSYNEFKKSLK